VATNQALEAARALALNPSLAQVMRQARLPADISTLLQFLAGELDASELMNGDAKRLLDIVESYVVVVMLFSGASPARVLGVSDGVSRDRARSHMRWLMIWLHPDRSGDVWRAPYSARVLEAWRLFSRMPSTSSPDAPLSKSRRPQTRPTNLTWIAYPVPLRLRVDKKMARVPPALLILAIAIIIFLDNPLREWVETLLPAYALRSLKL
jgi:hypothetical protein